MSITNETLLITDSDLVKLTETLKKIKNNFRIFALILIVATPLLPFYRGKAGRVLDDIKQMNGTYRTPDYNWNWYLHKLITGFIITIGLLIFVYYKTIKQIKKDIQYGTKFRASSTIIKDDKKENIKENQKFAQVEFATEEDHPQLSLWYYIKKNIFNKNTKVDVPIEIYNSFSDNENVIIEYSTYSNTFLNIKKI